MIAIPEAFSTSYAKARVKFLEAGAIAGLQLASFKHPLPGRDGEQLATDVALEGDPASPRLLIVSSACHGVEGFCGSGVQVFALHDAEWRAKAREAGVAVLYIHALNPYGFSHVRRVTQENVDLNRNFHDFSAPLPVNEGYRRVHPLLFPPTWPPDAANQAAIQDFVARHGLAAWPAATPAGSTNTPTACSTAATRPPGATRPCAPSCASTPGTPATSPGSTCTPAWARTAWASASTPARVTPPP